LGKADESAKSDKAWEKTGGKIKQEGADELNRILLHLSPTFLEAQDSLNNFIHSLREGVKHANEHTKDVERKNKQEASEAEEFFRRLAETQKKNQEESNRIIGESSKLEKLKQEFANIEKLVGAPGGLTRAQADKAEKELMKRERPSDQRAHFMNPEDISKNLQESLGDPGLTQKEMLAALKEIQKNTAKHVAVLGA